jgi:hypothetical protein
VLVRTGYGARVEHQAPDGMTADAVVNNLIEATGWILENLAVASRESPVVSPKS